MPRAVRFDHYGDLDVLEVREIDVRDPGAGEVRIEVHAAGVNPGEAAIRSGAMAAQFPATFPSGQGTEFAGVVAAVGLDVTTVAVGDAVIGFSDGRDAQAEAVVVPFANTLPKPANMDWATAALMPIAGATATAMVRSVGLVTGETVVVAGAGGGIGFTAAQLARRLGAHVIGTAGGAGFAGLRDVGVTPVEYGDGVEERIRAAAPNGVDAFLDTHGGGQADLAIALGVKPARVDSIIDFAAGSRLGIQNQGMYQLDDMRAAIIEFAALVDSGEVIVPIRARFPLDDVREAYRALEHAPGIGKIVLEVRS